MAIEGGMLGALSYLLRPMFDQVFVVSDMAALWWVGLSILGLFIIRGMASVGQKVLLTRAIERVRRGCSRVFWRMSWGWMVGFIKRILRAS